MFAGLCTGMELRGELQAGSEGSSIILPEQSYPDLPGGHWCQRVFVRKCFDVVRTPAVWMCPAHPCLRALVEQQKISLQTNSECHLRLFQTFAHV